MGFITSALTFVLIFAILVFFHELGHFLFAKLFKMRVEEFALGMGRPKLRLFSDGETEYTLRAIPLGGFVRIAGMEIEDSYESRLTGNVPQTRHSESAEEGLETTNISTMRQEEADVSGVDPNGFNSRPIYQRFLVILAGPVFSLLLGYFAFVLMFSLYGVPDGPATTRIEMVTAKSPADKAGIAPGDTILAVNGKTVKLGQEMIDAIRASKGEAINLSVESGPSKTVREVSVTPQIDVEKGEKIPRIGVSPGQARRSVGTGEAFTIGGRFVGVYFQMIGKIFASGKAKEAVGGPVAIAKAVNQATKTGSGEVSIGLLAQLSLSLGIFNLFPIPILDGGHLALMFLEAIRRRKLTAEQTQRVFATGLAILGLLFVYVMIKDIFLTG
jgi:regulator of sigma E protease